MMRESVIYQDIKQEGWQEGHQEGERSMVLKLLDRKLGTLPAEIRATVNTLSRPKLEALGEALLDFGSINDLSQWLENH
jgi:predicted transposase YdaD